MILDRFTETPIRLSNNTPRKKKLRSEINTLRKAESSCRKQLESDVTLDEVLNFLQKNYSQKACELLKCQLNLLNKSPKGCRYSDEYKQFALSIYFLGPKAYKKMSNYIKLPSKSTLNRFTKKWVINPGFNNFIFKLIELRTRLMNSKEKDCFICLDEISIKANLFYDISKDKVIGFQEGINANTEIASTTLVIMARGLAYSWKQPIAYFFYKSTAPSDDLKDILFQTVRKLSAIGLNVLGVVSDQGPNFQKLVKKTLNLTENDPCFFVDNIKLVYLFDIPHLLKSTRNNLFSYLFLSTEGEINKKYIETMYNYDKSKDYRLCPKLTDEHIYPNSFQKMKVKYAAQVLSHSVSVALNWFVDFKLLPSAAKLTADFLHKMNNLFDILNSSHLNNFNIFKGSEQHINFLNEMITFFKELKIVNHMGKEMTKTVKFTFGWQLTIKGVLELWEMLKEKDYSFLLTRHLNQDCLENFFGQIRNCSGNARNPTPIQFARAFKKLFALKYINHEEGGNCMEDINDILLNVSSNLFQQNAQIFLPPINIQSSIKVFTNDYRKLQTSEGNALVYITGYLLKKALAQHSCQICQEYTNLSDLEEKESQFCNLKAYHSDKEHFGGLTVPPKNMVEYITLLENKFVDNFNDFAYQSNIGAKFRNIFSDIPFPHPCKDFPISYFISLYIRVRIYFTLKFVNRDIRTLKTNKPNSKVTILKNL